MVKMVWMGDDDGVKFLKLFCLSSAIIVVSFHFDYVKGDDRFGPLVQINQGQLRGSILTSRDGREYNAFYHVPYGTAGRFENPRAAGKWEGIYNATTMGEQCAQCGLIDNEISGVEDCLNVNIYTPSLNGKKPVMVFFHGGAFTIGTANYYHADYFMDEDVVLVTVNYRLGALGFLSTGEDGVISGNFGLKDQSLSLRFVQENIEKFGGDANNVAIFGQSAGGASVNYHLISPQSKGLFKTAISHSGSVLCPWGYTKEPHFVNKKFAKALNCPSESRGLLACLQKMSAYDLLKGTIATVEWSYDPFTPFGPVIEKNAPGAFLTERPEILLETGNFNRVNWVIGVGEHEGILMHAGYLLSNPHLLTELKSNWRQLFPITLEYNGVYQNLSKEKEKETTEKIFDYYFGAQKTINSEAAQGRQALIDLYGDRLFNYGIQRAAIMAAKYVQVYPYVYAFKRKDFSVMEFFGIKNGNFDVTHGDELSMLFSHVFDLAPDLEKGSVAEQISKNLVKLWVSIARDKKPTQLWSDTVKSWEPISLAAAEGKEPIKYFWIDEHPSLRNEKFSDRLKFWDEIHQFWLKHDQRNDDTMSAQKCTEMCMKKCKLSGKEELTNFCKSLHKSVDHEEL